MHTKKLNSRETKRMLKDAEQGVLMNWPLEFVKSWFETRSYIVYVGTSLFIEDNIF